MSALANATLVAIHAPGRIAPDGNTTVGPPIWQGHALGWLRRIRLQTTVTAGTPNGRAEQAVTAQRDELIVRTVGDAVAVAQVIAGADWEASTVVIDDQRGPVSIRRRWTVVGVDQRAAGTIADSVRIELDDPQDVAS